MATQTQQKAKQLSQNWWDNNSSKINKQPKAPAQPGFNYDEELGKFLESNYRQTKADEQYQYDRGHRDTAYQLQQKRSYDSQKERNAVANKRQDAILQNSLQQQNIARQSNSGGTRSSASSGSAFGKWSGPTLSYTNGMANGRENTQRIQDFNFQRGQAAQSAAMISKAEAAGDIARAKGQADAQKGLLAAQSRSDIDKMNRQNAADMNKMRLQNSLSSRENAADRAQRDRLAKLDAATRLQQSMWGSFSNNGNGGGFQYWGGSI
ncbi:MAG: hypothetical protein WBF90_33760 [Rivularia sp. (in: cyanobacteria)]